LISQSIRFIKAEKAEKASIKEIQIVKILISRNPKFQNQNFRKECIMNKDNNNKCKEGLKRQRRI
jgi:hypothetical protein